MYSSFQFYMYVNFACTCFFHSPNYFFLLYAILAYYAWPRTPSTKVTRKERNPWRQHVHRATRPRSYAIDKVWEALTSRCLGNGRSDASCKQHGGIKSIICYLCFMQHAWSCCFFFLYFFLSFFFLSPFLNFCEKFNKCIIAAVFCDFCIFTKSYEGTLFICGLNIIHFCCHALSALHFEAFYTSATFQSTVVLS